MRMSLRHTVWLAAGKARGIILFTSFGLFAPPNLTVVWAPLRNALAHLGQ